MQAVDAAATRRETQAFELERGALQAQLADVSVPLVLDGDDVQLAMPRTTPCTCDTHAHHDAPPMEATMLGMCLTMDCPA